MYIIIAGAGDVGFHLAKLLTNEEHDIILVDKNEEKLLRAAGQLDVATVVGSSTSYSVLKEAGVQKADLLISVTTYEENNLLTAIIGKNLGAKKTIARISNAEFLRKKELLDLSQIGVDEVISPEVLAGKEIKRLLRIAATTDTFDFDNGVLSLIGISIDDLGILKEKTLREASHLNPDFSFIPVAFLRDNQTIIPRGTNKFKLNDHAYFIAQPKGVQQVLSLTGKKDVKINDVMVLGGSRVGINAAQLLSKKFNVKLIEKDKQKCFQLADMLADVLVINGDGRDVELLQEEGIDEMDAFIAVTGNSETNIISSLVAKNNGVAKTIALVENMDYIHLSQKIGVDTLINKKLIAANFIFRYIRRGDVVSITSLHGVDAEIVEFEVKETSKVCNKQLAKLHFPKSAIVGGVIRNGEGHIAMGDFVFKPKDRVVVVAHPSCIHNIESLFI